MIAASTEMVKLRLLRRPLRVGVGESLPPSEKPRRGVCGCGEKSAGLPAPPPPPPGPGTTGLVKLAACIVRHSCWLGVDGAVEMVVAAEVRRLVDVEMEGEVTVVEGELVLTDKPFDERRREEEEG